MRCDFGDVNADADHNDYSAAADDDNDDFMYSTSVRLCFALALQNLKIQRSRFVLDHEKLTFKKPSL